MTTKNTYNPEDIESLLMTKLYTDLLPEEKEFVMQHIDSKDEYNLLRTTLLAIKKSSDNDELIEANPKTKEALLLLMESKSNRGAWFNLNSLWSFLFPADIFFVKKPGFQLVSFSILLLFGFYFGNQFLELQSTNLAINKTERKTGELDTQQEKITESKEILTETEFDTKEEITRSTTIELTEKAPSVNELKIKPINFDSFDEVADEIMVSPKEVEDIVSLKSIDKKADQVYLDNDFVEAEQELLNEVVISKNQAQVITEKNDLESVSISSERRSEKKKDNKSLTGGISTDLNKLKAIDSQSLADEVSIIDLLYTTL